MKQTDIDRLNDLAQSFQEYAILEQTAKNDKEHFRDEIESIMTENGIDEFFGIEHKITWKYNKPRETFKYSDFFKEHRELIPKEYIYTPKQSRPFKVS